MENSKFVNYKNNLLLIFSVFLGAFILFFSLVFAYSPYYTHPDLTEEIAKLWNLKNKNQDLEISQKEINWMQEGAINEDEPPRWINHFYDPIHNEEWKGRHFGNLSEEEGYKIGADVAPKEAITSLDWATNQEYQAAYGRQHGNQTWQKAIKSYIDNDKKSAFIALGHILHLIEDASVPDHTRNDTHAHLYEDPGSPYEDYSKEYTNKNKLNISDNLKSEELPSFLTIEDAFEYMANYSNRNFFSEDTINNEEFNSPNIKILQTKEEIVNNKTKSYLYLNRVYLAKKDINKFNIIYTTNDELFVLPSYFSNLSEQAVLTGASVIDLFFREVKKYKKNEESSLEILPDQHEPFLQTLKHTPKLAVLNIADFIDKNATEIKVMTIKTYQFTQETIDKILSVKSTIISVESQLAVVSPPEVPEETIPTSDVNQSAVGETPNSAMEPNLEVEFQSSANLPATLNKTEAAIMILETQAIEIAQTQTQTQQNKSRAGSFASLPYAGFGGGGEIVNVNNANHLANLETKSPSDNLGPTPPTINSPNDFSQTFTSATITFQGTAKASSTIFTDFSSATTTTGQNNSWQMALTFPQGTTTLNFFAKDAANNVSSSTPVELFVDSEAPATPTLAIAECQNSLAVGTCLVATTTLHLNWSSAAQDLDYFELSYGNLTSTTTATSTILSLNDNSAYVFSLRARDQSENWSAATTTALEINTIPVIINEIAWMGTASSTEDEWIELYNRTNRVINLNNWVLRVSDDRPYIPLSGTILAKGYYLLERKDDNTISDLAADLVYGNDGADWALNNTGTEILILSRASTTVDRTPSANWPGGTTASFRTMERYNPDVSGEEISNWGTNITIIRNSKDAASSPINGTPKARNSVNYLIAKGAGTISGENVILTKDRSPYLVNNIVQIFQNNAILTVEPGVIIKFYNDAGMNFNGAAIKAQGAVNEPIVFTSFYDDEYGGDTNADATSSLPDIGDWYGVDIVSGGSGSILDRTVFRYGGKYYTPTSETDRTLVKVENTSISIKNSIFEYSKAHGLVLVNSTSTVENNIFRNNDNYSEQGKGLFAASGNYSIKNNEFSQNQTGLYLSDAAAIVDANTFSNNAQKAVYSSGLVGKFTNNLASQNGKNGIVLDGNLAAAGATSTLNAAGIPYVISEGNPAVPVGSALIVESGAIIKGLGKGLQVSGQLALNAENPEDIVLTSLSDDSVGGDTDNAVNSAGPGDWSGINLAANASFQGKGFTMRYAGSQSSNGQDSAGLKMTTGLANITNALFDTNYPYGIYAVANSELNISNSRFENHNYSGPWGTKAALTVFDSTSALAGVSFLNNSLGILSDTVSTWIASAVEFVGNTATTSPTGLF